MRLPFVRRKKVEQAMALLERATEQATTCARLYTNLADKYLAVLDENLKLKQNLAEERAIACSVQEGLLRKQLPQSLN
jgi:hypothetical protein